MSIGVAPRKLKVVAQDVPAHSQILTLQNCITIENDSLDLTYYVIAKLLILPCQQTSFIFSGASRASYTSHEKRCDSRA